MYTQVSLCTDSRPRWKCERSKYIPPATKTRTLQPAYLGLLCPLLCQPCLLSSNQSGSLTSTPSVAWKGVVSWVPGILSSPPRATTNPGGLRIVVVMIGVGQEPTGLMCLGFPNLDWLILPWAIPSPLGPQEEQDRIPKKNSSFLRREVGMETGGCPIPGSSRNPPGHNPSLH